MGMISTDIVAIGSVDVRPTNIKHSLVEKIVSSDSILVSTGLNKRDQDSDFVMKSTSRASSKTSSTEPLEDSVGDGEEEEDVEHENRAIAAAVESIREIPSDMLDPPEGGSERRHTAPPCTQTRQFGFSTITVREYPRDLGDNITVMGPPIGLSWEHQEEVVYDLIEYDEACQDTRRTQSELKMPSSHRDKILRDMGYSRKDIQHAIKKSNVARGQRKRTVETLKLQPLQEMFEKVVRVGSKPLRKKDAHLRVDKMKTV